MFDETGINIIQNHHVSLYCLAAMKYADKIMKYDEEKGMELYDKVGKVLGMNCSVSTVHKESVEKFNKRCKEVWDEIEAEILAEKEEEESKRKKWGLF